MNTITVQAAPGTRVPKEGKPRDYITDSQAATVPASQYYRRLVRDSSLAEIPAETPPAEKTVGKKAIKEEA